MNQRAWLFLLLLSTGFVTTMACRERGADVGIGGQSGDEGRRDPWLGAGGAGSHGMATLPRPR